MNTPTNKPILQSTILHEQWLGIEQELNRLLDETAMTAECRRKIFELCGDLESTFLEAIAIIKKE